MELQGLYSLMERFAASGLTELEWEREGERIRLGKAALRGTQTEQAVAAPGQVMPDPPAAVSATAAEGELVKAPLVGVFYAAPAPGEPPLCQPRPADQAGGDPLPDGGHEDDQ